MEKIVMSLLFLTCTFTSYILKAEICSTEEIKVAAVNYLNRRAIKIEVYLGTPRLVNGEYGHFEIPVVTIYQNSEAGSGYVSVSPQQPCEGTGTNLIGLQKAN